MIQADERDDELLSATLAKVPLTCTGIERKRIACLAMAPRPVLAACAVAATLTPAVSDVVETFDLTGGFDKASTLSGTRTVDVTTWEVTAQKAVADGFVFDSTKGQLDDGGHWLVVSDTPSDSAPLLPLVSPSQASSATDVHGCFARDDLAGGSSMNLIGGSATLHQAPLYPGLQPGS